MNYYERHIGDYLKDTAHLSLLEHGVYARLLDVYYTKECGIEESMAARLIGARAPEEIAAMNVVLLECFILQSGVWTQSRCDREIERYREKQRKAKASADARWANADRTPTAMPPDSERNANALPPQSEGNALQTPDTRHQTPKKRRKKVAVAPVTLEALMNDGLPRELAEGWLAHRDAKKAPLTPLAWAGFLSEVEKAGWTASAAVEKAIARDWKGFEAAWVQDTRSHPQHSQAAPSFRERDSDAAKAAAARWMGTANPLNFSDMEQPDGTRALT